MMPKQKKQLQTKIKQIKWWTPPLMWEDETVYIIGGGPSLEGFDFTPIRQKHVIGCNDAYTLGTWVDVCLFGDYGWWLIHSVKEVVCHKKNRRHPGLVEFPGLIVSHTPPKRMVEFCFDHPRVRCMRRKSYGVKDPNRGVLSWYNNVGASAIHLALLFGCSKIVLLGFDMKRSGGKQNWHRAIKQEPDERRNKYHVEMHNRLARDVAGSNYRNVQILNANPDSDCEAWPKVSWEDVCP